MLIWIDIDTAAAVVGKSSAHLRRLCGEGRLGPDAMKRRVMSGRQQWHLTTDLIRRMVIGAANEQPATAAVADQRVGVPDSWEALCEALRAEGFIQQRLPTASSQFARSGAIGGGDDQ
jgi:hypothetical protein